MSYTTVKALWPNEKQEDFEELRNSHGSAPVIWDAMMKKYIGGEHWLTGNIDKLWKLWERCDIPIYLRAVLMMTFDRAYVIKKDYEEAAKHIRLFLNDYPPESNKVNHWPRIAEIFESNPDIPAIGLYCTSVSEDPFEGEYDEEKEEYGQPDWEQCFDIYKDLESICQDNGQ